MDFQTGYTCEFRHRISGPVARNLIETGHTNYSHSESEKKFVKEGKFNGALTLGEQLWYLSNDKLVRTIISNLDLSVDAVLRCGSAINKPRCTAAHYERSATTEVDVRKVRELIREGLLALFPQRQSI